MNDATSHETSQASKELSYEQFGQQFIHLLVTPARIERELKALLADPIKGVVSRLPAELLMARYTFYLQEVQVVTRPECLPQLGLRQRISGLLALSVNLLGLSLRFTLQLVIHLEQIVRAFEPLILKIETRPLDTASVELQVDSHGIPSEIADRLNLIERAVRAEVVDEVNKRLVSGPIAEATAIDVSRIADNASLVPASAA
ncbi:MAG: hypothetical protein ACRES4_01400 [Nevskiales bacterium]